MKLNTIQILLLCIIHLSKTFYSVKINFPSQKSEVSSQSTLNYIIAQNNISNILNKSSSLNLDTSTDKYVKAKIIPSLNSDFLVNRDEDELKKYYLNLKSTINMEDTKSKEKESKIYSKDTNTKINTNLNENKQEPSFNNIRGTNINNIINVNDSNTVNNKDLFYNNFWLNFQKINSEFENFMNKSNILSQKLDELSVKNLNYTQEISKLRDSIYSSTKTSNITISINSNSNINSNEVKKTNSQIQMSNNSTLTNSNSEIKLNSHNIVSNNNNTLNSILTKENNQTTILTSNSNTNSIHSNSTEKIKASQLNTITNLKQSTNSKLEKKLETKLTQRQILESKTSSIQGINQNIAQALDNYKEMQELAVISNNLKKSIAEIKEFHSSFNQNFNEFEEVFSEKNLQETKKKYESSLLFYNSLSLIMLAMLAGGLVGVIFILYFSFHSKDVKN
jgi:hypothetical protein